MQITISVSFHLTFKLAPLSTDYSVGVSVVALPQSVINALLHVSVAGSPAVDSASDSGLDRLPPAPRRSAQCSAARGGLARMRSHPGSKQGFNGCLQTKKKHSSWLLSQKYQCVARQTCSPFTDRIYI